MPDFSAKRSLHIKKPVHTLRNVCAVCIISELRAFHGENTVFFDFKTILRTGVIYRLVAGQKCGPAVDRDFCRTRISSCRTFHNHVPRLRFPENPHIPTSLESSVSIDITVKRDIAATRAANRNHRMVATNPRTADIVANDHGKRARRINGAFHLLVV